MYEEEVRKLLYATEVFKPIEFDPVKFHLALQCRGLREEIGLPPGVRARQEKESIFYSQCFGAAGNRSGYGCRVRTFNRCGWF